jgi:hypothetical protein
MSTLFAGPEVLRTKAGQLRTHAASVAVALNNVDDQMRSLHSSSPSGRRADNLRCRYESQRQQLMDIPDLLTGFAQSLEQAAEIYELSDQNSAAPCNFDWLQVLQEVNRFTNQSLPAQHSRLTPLPAGIPRWYEWGKDAWQALVTPVADSIRDLVANLYAETPALQPSLAPAQPAPSPIQAETQSVPAHPDYSCSIDNLSLIQAYPGDIYKMSIEPAWSFTSIELFFLGGLLKLPGILGIADPFSGCVQDDIEIYLQLAHQSLLQRGYLSHTGDGEALDPALDCLLHTVASASQVIIAVQESSFIVLYQTPESIVLQQPLPEHQVGFFLLENQSAIVPHLQNLFSSSPVTPAPGTQITMAQSVLEHARAMLADTPSADKIAVCAASLTQTGLPPNSATAFALALARPVSTGYITLVRRDGTSTARQSGCAWLVGASGGWVTELPPSVFPASLTWQPVANSIVSFAVDQLFAIRTNLLPAPHAIALRLEGQRHEHL